MILTYLKIKSKKEKSKKFWTKVLKEVDGEDFDEKKHDRLLQDHLKIFIDFALPLFEKRNLKDKLENNCTINKDGALKRKI